MQKKAYSYIRFSSLKQQKGDSLRRQLEASRKYAKEHNLILDESLRDIGVSAFDGKNATEGALKRFLKLIENKQVEKGSVLILESLDRLSRQQVFSALSLFSSILSSGVEIVTLADGQHYTEESINDVGQLMYSLISMSRSHEESAIKAKRGKAAWDKKRQLAAELKRPMTRQCPKWLQVSKDMKSFLIHEDRAETIRSIFELSIGGMGQRKIATTLNENGTEPFTENGIWHATYIRELIKNKGLLGEYQPKHKGKPVGEVIINYYPVIITEDLFYRAQAETEKRLSPSSAGRKGSMFSNLFTGLCKCAKCKGTFRLIKSKDTAFLTCSNNRMSARCDCSKRWRYKNIESTALVLLSEKVDWFSTIGGNTNHSKELEGKIDSLNAKLAESKNKVGRFANLFTEVDESLFKDAQARYIEAMDEEKKITEEISIKKKELAVYTPSNKRAEDLTIAFSKLTFETERNKLYELRTQVNAALRDAGVILYFDEHAVHFYIESTKQKEILITEENEDARYTAAQLRRCIIPMGYLTRKN